MERLLNTECIGETLPETKQPSVRSTKDSATRHYGAPRDIYTTPRLCNLEKEKPSKKEEVIVAVEIEVATRRQVMADLDATYLYHVHKCDLFISRDVDGSVSNLRVLVGYEPGHGFCYVANLCA